MLPVVIPFALQGTAILADEFIFHRRRGLPRWERIGHPLDTATVVACLAFVLVVPYEPVRLWAFATLAVFSTIFVTKDEFVHSEVCGGAEQWLHALLFIAHPIVLLLTGCIWPIFWGRAPLLVSLDAAQAATVRTFFVGQLALVVAFLLYQVVYWNWLWKPEKTAPRPA